MSVATEKIATCKFCVKKAGMLLIASRPSLNVIDNYLRYYSSASGALSINSINWSSFGVMIISVRRLR